MTTNPAAMADRAALREANLRADADRSKWFVADRGGDLHTFWGPTMVGFTYEPTDAEWLAQAFREAVSKVHDAGVEAGPDPLNALARRALEEDPGHPNAAKVRRQIEDHADVEDADFNCRHWWCVSWWPMVRAAEARAILAATPAPEATTPQASTADVLRELRAWVARCDPITVNAVTVLAAIDTRLATQPEPAHEGLDVDDDMCPNCVTPWKCNGPHIPGAYREATR